MSAGWNLFGYHIIKANTNSNNNTDETLKQKTFALPTGEDDGAINVISGSHFGTFVDLEGVVRNEVELITKYREMAMQPELELAIDDIVNESIVMEESGTSVIINTDDVKISDNIKKRIQEEFDLILKMLRFGNNGHELFRRWYVDGRLFYHAIIDETNTRQGIKELRYIDPRRIRKVREIQKTKDPRTGAELVKTAREYYLYNERGVIGQHSNLGMRISPDSIINVNSGLMDSKRAMVLSFLHKAIKPLNNLRMIEDAIVIYRMSRAAERRIFYIDVGQLSTKRAEAYIKEVMTKYRQKLVYDAATGEVRNDRKFLSMQEDIWLARREGTKGTEISTLAGAQNLGELEDIKYFKKKLYEALSVPMSRTEQEKGFSLGRTSEITRDELKFNKFVQRLRNKFSTLFDESLKLQLVLKGVCTSEEWDEFKEDIWFDFKKDNNFTELKNMELNTARLQLLGLVDPFIGRFFSLEWVKKNVLNQSDEDIEEITKQLVDEKKELGDIESGPTASIAQQQQGEMQMQQQAFQGDIASQQAAQSADNESKSQQALEGDEKIKKTDKVDMDKKIKGLRENRENLNTIRKTIKENNKKVTI